MNPRDLKTIAKGLVTTAPSELFHGIADMGKSLGMLMIPALPWNWFRKGLNKHANTGRIGTALLLGIGAVGGAALGAVAGAALLTSAVIGTVLIVPSTILVGGLYVGVTSAVARIVEDVQAARRQQKPAPGGAPAPQPAPGKTPDSGTLKQAFDTGSEKAPEKAVEPKPAEPKPPAPPAA
jgi:hypothetical protein